jgi:hypothetical protein
MLKIKYNTTYFYLHTYRDEFVVKIQYNSSVQTVYHHRSIEKIPENSVEEGIAKKMVKLLRVKRTAVWEKTHAKMKEHYHNL